MNTNRTHRLTEGAKRIQWTAEHIAEPLRAAEESADARRAADVGLPANVKLVEFRYEWPAGQNVYNVYTDNLSCFNVYTATPGSDRDRALAALAGR